MKRPSGLKSQLEMLRAVLAGVVVVAVCAACQSSGPVRVVVDPNPNPIVNDAGAMDADQLSDPRLVHSDGLNPIGTLVTLGPAVYVNGVIVHGRVTVPHGSHLRTGANSYARVLFAARRNVRCEIGIQNFFAGNIYFESRRCGQRVETPHATVHAEPGGIEFEVSVTQGQTRVTVMRGGVLVRSRNNAMEMYVNTGQDVVATPGRVGGPGRATSNAGWRPRFPPMGDEPRPDPVPRDPVVDRTFEDAARRALEILQVEQRAREQRDQRDREQREQRDREQRDAEQRQRLEREQRERQEAERRQQQKVAYCRNYSQSAVAENRANIGERCNLSGSAWHSDANAHYAWCMAGDNAERSASTEERNRQAALQRCRQPSPIR